MIEHENGKKYLLLMTDEGEDFCENDYQIIMLEKYKIQGLIQPQIIMIDSKSSFRYDITTLISMSCIFENRDISKRDACSLFRSMLYAFEQMEDYMLDIDRLIFDVDKIFLDTSLENYYFIYNPAARDRGQLTDLMDYILQHYDYDSSDSDAVSLYELYKTVSKSGIDIPALKNYLELSEGEVYLKDYDFKMNQDKIIQDKMNQDEIDQDKIYRNKKDQVKTKQDGIDKANQNNKEQQVCGFKKKNLSGSQLAYESEDRDLIEGDSLRLDGDKFESNKIFDKGKGSLRDGQNCAKVYQGNKAKHGLLKGILICLIAVSGILLIIPGIININIDMSFKVLVFVIGFVSLIIVGKKEKWEGKADRKTYGSDVNKADRKTNGGDVNKADRKASNRNKLSFDRKNEKGADVIEGDEKFLNEYDQETNLYLDDDKTIILTNLKSALR